MNIDKLGKIVINGEEYDYIDDLEINFEHIKEDGCNMLGLTKNLTISCSGSLGASDELVSIIKKLPKSKVVFGLDLEELENNINKWVSEMEDTLLYCSVSSVKLLENRVLMAELIYKTLD